jgi:glc operon protein GlcG
MKHYILGGLAAAITVAGLALAAPSRFDRPEDAQKSAIRAVDHHALGHVDAATSLTLSGASAVLAAAVAEAARLGVGGGFAVVDASGELLAFARVDGTFSAASNVAIGKARTAARFRKATRVFEESINKGRTAMAGMPDFLPLQGGVPIEVAGRVVGAIGVSGASSAAQDEELALVGARALLGPQ